MLVTYAEKILHSCNRHINLHETQVKYNGYITPIFLQSIEKFMVWLILGHDVIIPKRLQTSTIAFWQDKKIMIRNPINLRISLLEQINLIFWHASDALENQVVHWEEQLLPRLVPCHGRACCPRIQQSVSHSGNSMVEAVAVELDPL